MALFGLTREYFIVAGPLFLAGWFGKFLDDQETLRMTRFRDRSALYGRVLKEGEQPSWP